MLIASHLLITPTKPHYRNEVDFEGVCLNNLLSIIKRAKKNESIVLLAPRFGKLSLNAHLWLVEQLVSLREQGREMIIVDTSAADVVTLATRQLITHIEDAKAHEWPFTIEKKQRSYIVNGQCLANALATPENCGTLYRFEMSTGELLSLPLDKEAALNTHQQVTTMSALEDSLFISKLKAASNNKYSSTASERITTMIEGMEIDGNTKHYLRQLQSEGLQ